jgi:hypothetical protein
MADKDVEGRTRFVVDLGSVELPPVVARQVESEIRTVVLKALAGLESEASFRLDPRVFGKFGGQTLGIWFDPDNPDIGTFGEPVLR